MVRPLAYAALLCLLLTPLVLPAQPASDPPRDENAVQLQNDLWQAIKTKDEDALRRLVPDDAVIVAAGTEHVARDYFSDLRNLTVNQYAMTNVHTTKLQGGAVILTYVLTGSVNYQGRSVNGSRLLSSVWEDRNGQWQMVFAQESPAPRREQGGHP